MLQRAIVAQLSDIKTLCGQYDQHEVGASSLRAWCFVLRNQSELEERLFFGISSRLFV